MTMKENEGPNLSLRNYIFLEQMGMKRILQEKKEQVKYA
jgi:hypothetical protein